MLYATKKELAAGLAVDMLEIRRKEISLYSGNLTMVGGQATLLAGFSFANLQGASGLPIPDDGFLPAEWLLTLGLDPSEGAQDGFLGWDWLTWLRQFFNFGFLLFTTMGMCLQLWVVIGCTVANILALNLSLRGPDGSVARAVCSLQAENKRLLGLFSKGLFCFVCSTVCYFLGAWPLHFGIPATVLTVGVFFRVEQHMQELVDDLWVTPDQEVHGDFFEHQAGSRDRTSTTAHPPPSDRPPRLLGQFKAWLGLSSEGAGLRSSKRAPSKQRAGERGGPWTELQEPGSSRVGDGGQAKAEVSLKLAGLRDERHLSAVAQPSRLPTSSHASARPPHTSPDGDTSSRGAAVVPAERCNSRPRTPRSNVPTPPRTPPPRTPRAAAEHVKLIAQLEGQLGIMDPSREERASTRLQALARGANVRKNRRSATHREPALDSLAPPRLDLFNGVLQFFDGLVSPSPRGRSPR